MTRGFARTLGVLACCVLLQACALTRSEITVTTQVSSQPASGVAVVIAPIDRRHFQATSEDPSVPTLSEPTQIGDAQITSRALGRKRNTYGAALGDVLLLPGQSAAALVGDAVKAGLRDAGVRVLEPSDPGYAAAPKVRVDIEEFWTWVTPGWMIKLDHQTRIVLEGGLQALRGSPHVTVRDRKEFMMIGDSQWAPFIKEMLDKVRVQVRDVMGGQVPASAPSATVAATPPPAATPTPTPVASTSTPPQSNRIEATPVSTGSGPASLETEQQRIAREKRQLEDEKKQIEERTTRAREAEKRLAEDEKKLAAERRRADEAAAAQVKVQVTARERAQLEREMIAKATPQPAPRVPLPPGVDGTWSGRYTCQANSSAVPVDLPVELKVAGGKGQTRFGRNGSQTLTLAVQMGGNSVHFQRVHDNANGRRLYSSLKGPIANDGISFTATESTAGSGQGVGAGTLVYYHCTVSLTRSL